MEPDVNSRAHWDAVYRRDAVEKLSWYQAEARTSLELIRRGAPSTGAHILDAGGGASTLVDGLLAAGYTHVGVLDLAPTALERARARLGAQAPRVRWIEADILTFDFPQHSVDVWHDRAVFHFLTEPGDRARYLEQVRHAVRPGGIVLVATFADDGPTRCSGLDVVRYTPDALLREFGDDFRLLEAARETHVTPRGIPQAFTFCLFRREPQPS